MAPLELNALQWISSFAHLVVLVYNLLLRGQNRLNGNFANHVVRLIFAVVTIQHFDVLGSLFLSQILDVGNNITDSFSFQSLAFGFLQIQCSGTFLVGLFELFFVLFEILSNLFDFRLGQELGAGSPLELVKGFERLLVQLFSLETPQNVSIVHGKLEVSSLDGLGDARGNGTTIGIPKNLVGTVVLLDGKRFGVDVVKFQRSGCGISQTGHENGAPGWTPKEAVALFSLEGFDLVELGNHRR
mmetsp:Transcript_14247/g.29471  ORF Transcript_14247/g.29471 Transcript_14247/m.29471 type:complete len:243 (+) Transcript_14247:235-963(+)